MTRAEREQLAAVRATTAELFERARWILVHCGADLEHVSEGVAILDALEEYAQVVTDSYVATTDAVDTYKLRVASLFERTETVA